MKGWILDLYPGRPGEMVVWLKLEDGSAVRLVDSWSSSFFVASDDRTDLKLPLEVLSGELAWWRTVRKRERITDWGESEVVEARVKDARRVQQVAERLEGMGPFDAYRIYNADVPPNQAYLYEHDLFPLAYCDVEQAGGRLEWELKDDVMAYDYHVPNLRSVKVDASIEKKGRLPTYGDRLKEIRLDNGAESFTIDGRDEAETILEAVKAVRDADPDFVLTTDGDTFLMPYLVKRAEANGVGAGLRLGRDPRPLRMPAKKGTSYFQYGKIRYKPSSMKLYGRVHIDVNTSFAFSEAGFEGLFELSRVCRMPLQTASRASIGKALSSLQFYHASKMGLLVPWKPTLAERFKDRAELLVADRGGFIFEPRMGLYEGVGELDFSCLAKETRVLTKNGEVAISELEAGAEVFTPFGWQKVLRIHKYLINDKVFRITLADGRRITCTQQHRFPVLVRDVFEEKMAGEIRKGNRFIVTDSLPLSHNDDLSCLFGVFTAEGYSLRKEQRYFDKSRGKTRISHQYRIEFSIDKREIDLHNFIVGTLSKIYPGVRVYTRPKQKSNGIDLAVAQKAVVNDFLSRYASFIASERHNRDEEASFVRGFFEGDGGVNIKRNTVQCNQSSKNHSKLETVCKYLRDLGIRYRVGRYDYEYRLSPVSADFLELSGLEAVVRYSAYVGFISRNKQQKLHQAILNRIRKARNYPKGRLGLYTMARKNNALSFIHEVRVMGKEILEYNDAVYDLTLEWQEFPYYFANGILTHNSLYPNIMLKKNISAETVRCPCCPDSENRVPELDWNVCKRRKGVVPTAIDIIVTKRLRYKELKKHATGAEYDRYSARQAVLKWIGVTCLPRESPVFVKRGSTERLVRIGDFIDSLVGERTGVLECPPDVFVAGIGPDYKAKYSRVANLIKKPNSQKLLSVEMEDGRKIVTTPDHPFFILHQGELKTVMAEDLVVGEAVPAALRLPSATHADSPVDLIERLENSLGEEEQKLWRVSGGYLKERIRERRRDLLQSAVSEGYSYQAAASWAKTGIIPLKFLRLLGIDPRTHGAMRVGAGRRGGGRIAWLPAVIKVDENLGFFLGLYVADGSATRTYVRIDIASSEPELLRTTRKLAESLFGVSPHVYKETKAQMHVVQINNASLVRILEKVFDLPGSAEKGKLKVPDIIFNCGAQAAHRFIAGLVAGDGSASKKSRFVGVATASKAFQEQVAFLSAKLGLTYRLAASREGKHPLYTVNFAGPETLGIIGNWAYSKENKRATIQSWSSESSSTCDHPRYLRLPAKESGLFALVRATRTSSEPHVLEEGRTCPAQVRKKLVRMRARGMNEAELEQRARIVKMVNGDLGFVRVTKIKKLEERPEYVYCFQLADGEVPGFHTGEGLIFTHNCFGYLGFNNAKFGRIDAHIAVCAWDRRLLVDAARVAERRGYEVIHGIVDSLWVRRRGAEEHDFLDLRAEIERETGFELSFEGIYKWIAFLPSKADPALPVLNRYFGAYRTGVLKVRGVEARRHDTPAFFKRCQMEILRALARAGTLAEAKGRVPECVEVFLKYADAIRGREVPAEDLAYSRNLSRTPDEYSNRTLQASVAAQLAEEGADLHAGEGVRYVITDYGSRGSKRAAPLEFGSSRRYDAGRYVALLAEACASVLAPFEPSCDPESLVRRHEHGPGFEA
jgi:DNA polymerase elongation subunit (family B)